MDYFAKKIIKISEDMQSLVVRRRMKALEIGNSRLGKSSSRCPIQDNVCLCLPCLQAVIYPSLNETRFQRIFDLETINFKNLSTLRMTRNYRAKKPLNNQTPTRASNAAKKYHSFSRDKPLFQMLGASKISVNMQ